MSELETPKEARDNLGAGLKVIAISVIRTLTPVLAGQILSLLLWAGLDLSEVALTIEAVVTTVLTLGYYVIVRLLETYVTPKLGWLLGSPRQVVYVKDTGTQVYEPEVDENTTLF